MTALRHPLLFEGRSSLEFEHLAIPLMPSLLSVSEECFDACLAFMSRVEVPTKALD